MHHRTILPLLLLPLIAAVAGCGDADVPGAMAASTGATASPPDLLPLFNGEGRVARDAESGLPIVTIRAGSAIPEGLRPAFDEEGLVKRCPLTDAALSTLETDSRTCLVRMPN